MQETSTPRDDRSRTPARVGETRLLLWIRENRLTQGTVASAAGRSDAWMSKRLRGHSLITSEDRQLIRTACEVLVGKRVRLMDIFDPEAAA